MVRQTKRKGGMIGTLKKAAQPLGRATVILGKEYGKDWAQQKAPKVAKGIYNDPSLATDTSFILTGTKKFPTPTPRSIPQFDINDIDIDNSENINPNIMKGGKTKRRRKLQKKTSRNRK
jgi:hypothetical protein